MEYKRVTENELTNFKKTVGENIKFYRKARGLTQAKLGEMVGLADNTLSGIEGGNHHPEIENLLSIAKALDVAPYELYMTNRQERSSAKSAELDKKIKEAKKIEQQISEDLKNIKNCKNIIVQAVGDLEKKTKIKQKS